MGILFLIVIVPVAVLLVAWSFQICSYNKGTHKHNMQTYAWCIEFTRCDVAETAPMHKLVHQVREMYPAPWMPWVTFLTPVKVSGRATVLTVLWAV